MGAPCKRTFSEIGPSMGRPPNIRLESLLAQSERCGRFLVVRDRPLQRSAHYLVTKQELVEPAPGVYVRKTHWDRLPKRERAVRTIQAVQLIHPDWTFCFNSAAAMLDLPISLDDPEIMHVTTTSSQRAGSTKQVRRHVVDGDETICRRGVRTTSFARTVLDCMRSSDFRMAVAIADSALRSGQLGRAELLSYFQSVGRHLRGTSRAIAAMLYADPRSESVGESLARATMVESGFALPELQAVLPHPLERGKTFRVDFLWMRKDGSRVIGEFDGAIKYEDPATRNGRSALRVLEDERKRESLLTFYGMPIVRFSYKDVMGRERFCHLLTRYGIPNSQRMKDAFRRAVSTHNPSALTFSVSDF